MDLVEPETWIEQVTVLVADRDIIDEALKIKVPLILMYAGFI